MKIKIKNNKKDILGKKGFYLLPNIFTTASLFAGFYAIVQAMNGAFDHSAIAIFIALILDGLDGRVARLKVILALNTIVCQIWCLLGLRQHW